MADGPFGLEYTVNRYTPGRPSRWSSRFEGQPEPSAPASLPFDFSSVPNAGSLVPRPIPQGYPYGPLSWTEYEKDRIAGLPMPQQPSSYPYGPGTWRQQISSGQTPSEAASIAAATSGVSSSRVPFADARRFIPYTDQFGRLVSEAPSSLTGTVQDAGDWADLIAALGGVGGGGGYTPVSVNRELFRLQETPEEAALLAREMADIEARTAAGRTALTAGWANVADTNRRAAEKARAQVVGAGDAAAAGWVNAANTASELAAARAQQAGAFEGRQAINVSPTGGAEDFIMFMQSQAPAAAELARGRQETLASDLDWMAGMAGQQGEAYAADLQRQANVFAFERAREHNRAVQERINAERMALAQMEFQAASTNAQLAQAAARETGRGATEIQGALVTSLLAGDAEGPAVLASVLGIDPAQALRLYNSAKSSPLGISLLNQATRRTS